MTCAVHSKKEFPYKDSPEVGREKSYVEFSFFVPRSMIFKCNACKRARMYKKTVGKDPSHEAMRVRQDFKIYCWASLSIPWNGISFLEWKHANIFVFSV